MKESAKGRFFENKETNIHTYIHTYIHKYITKDIHAYIGIGAVKLHRFESDFHLDPKANIAGCFFS